MDEPNTFKYDVAISFMQADEPVAQSLADALRQTCSVFIYSEQQHELAGKDGAEEFTAVFRDQSRVCVILYRDGWGTTKWTRVEETAVKDRAFETGWEFLTVVALSAGAPKWLPKTKLWLGYERFGLQGAVAVIEARVREQGGEAVEESARAKAERLARVSAARSERDLFLDSARGVAAAKEAVNELREYVKAEAEAMRSQKHPLDISFDEGGSYGVVFGISCAGSALTFGWSTQHSDTLRYSSLFIQEFDRAYRVGGRHREPVSTETWLFTRTLEGSPAWHEEQSPDQLLSSRALGEYFMSRFLDRAHDDRPRAFDEW